MGVYPCTRPVIGITPAFDDGTDLDSLRPNVALNFIEASYLRAVEQSGGIPVVLPLSDEPAVIDAYLHRVDGLVLSGGGGYLRRRHLRQQLLPDLKVLSPKRFAYEARLLSGALDLNVPVLGICRGHQMIARITGGSCFARIAAAYPDALEHYQEGDPIGRTPVHGIAIRPGTRLAELLGTQSIMVNSLHRQAVQRLRPPFVVSARAEDGVAEALESTAHRFALGVQFHPELLMESDSRWGNVFAALVRAADEFALARLAAVAARISEQEIENLPPPGVTSAWQRPSARHRQPK